MISPNFACYCWYHTLCKRTLLGRFIAASISEPAKAYLVISSYFDKRVDSLEIDTEISTAVAVQQ